MSRERALLQRLARIDALRRGATTPGERQAAEQAQARLTERLEAERAADPLRHFIFAHAAEPAVEPAPPPRPRRMPEERALLGALLRWEHDDIDGAALRKWARRAVDQVVFPKEPDNPATRRGEVLLVLASRRLGGLERGDIAEIRAFLAGGSWEAWFALLARAARR